MNKQGAWEEKKDITAIQVGQGLLVQVVPPSKIKPEEGTKLLKLKIANKHAKAEAKYNDESIDFIVSNGDYEDATSVVFAKGYGLSKINHRNPNIPMIYINQDGNNYAVATMGDEVKEFNLNFKAKTVGRYTLRYEMDGNFDYLHVYDCLTGRDIDMLVEGEYSFIGSPKDRDSRFIVRLQYKPNYGADGSGTFAYQVDESILVSGKGDLQVFDVAGRMIINMRMDGVEKIGVPTKGVYILRLVGDDVKTQKIVVR